MLLVIVTSAVVLWTLGALVVVAICRAAALGDDAFERRAAEGQDRAARFTHNHPVLR